MDIMPSFVGITGPTGSGKSSICRKLENKSRKRVPMDNFYKPKDKWKADNWDKPEAIKFDEFCKFLKELKETGKAMMPVFDRRINKIVDEERVVKKETMLVEGFMLLYNERVRDLLDKIIFLDIPKKIQKKRRKKRFELGGCDFNEERFEKQVWPGYKKYILPNKKHADRIVDARPELDKVVEKVRKIIES